MRFPRWGYSPVRLLAIARQWERSDDERRALLADVDELEHAGMGDRLRAIASTLTTEEHRRLAAEASAGDRLAEMMLAVLATPRDRVEVLRCRCGGIAWYPDPSGRRERCAACGTLAPFTVDRGRR